VGDRGEKGEERSAYRDGGMWSWSAHQHHVVVIISTQAVGEPSKTNVSGFILLTDKHQFCRGEEEMRGEWERSGEERRGVGERRGEERRGQEREKTGEEERRV